VLHFSCCSWLTFFLKVVSNIDLKGLNKLLEAHRDVASHLCKRSSEDQAYDVSVYWPPCHELYLTLSIH
jgi:hypothetical protein